MSVLRTQVEPSPLHSVLLLHGFLWLGSLEVIRCFAFLLFIFNRNCKLSNSNFSMAAVDILYIDITRRWNSMGIDHKESGNAILYLKIMKIGVFSFVVLIA